jgi:predicted PurR-regulated permease PerM
VPTGSASKRQRLANRDLSESQFENLLRIAAQVALVFLGVCATIVALQAAHVVLAPIALAVIVGLVFGPVADRLERLGIPSALSALVVVVALIVLIASSILLFAVPLSEWVGRAPAIWDKFRNELLNWKEPLEALALIQEQIKTALGGSEAMQVSVQDGSQVLDIALIAPQILADILIFLVSLYFYLATRDNIRMSVLSLCVSRRMRWRTAHVFRDVETKVSRFLLSVTFLNICVGIAMWLLTWWLGLPSPLLWGALAAVLNYIPYVGQAIMLIVLLAVGLGTQTGIERILAPAGVYLIVNFVEGQLVFPQFVGRTMTLNPFLIFLSIIFWIWVWGPFGSLMAVPSLLILQSVITNVLPSKEVKPRRPVRRTARMTDRDMVLANAAKAIKEQAEDLAEAAAAAEAARQKPVEPEVLPEPVAVAVVKKPRRAVATKPAAAT